MLDRILTNWPLKVLAIVLAFAIWVSVTGEKRTLQDFQVPLEVRVADELVLASTPPNTVTVRLRGSESLLRRLDPLPIVVRADLTDASTGEQDVQLSAGDIGGLPRGVEVDFIDPDRIRVVIAACRRYIRIGEAFRHLKREAPMHPREKIVGREDRHRVLHQANSRTALASAMTKNSPCEATPNIALPSTSRSSPNATRS